MTARTSTLLAKPSAKAWGDEDYFKALKTGCSLEKRESGSYQALTKVTALLAPVAYRLLLLRGLERQNPTGSASAFFDEVDLALMQMDDATSGMPPLDSLAAALRYLARMGGHLKHNGPPGWITLGRGFEKLLALRRGWEAAQTLRVARKDLQCCGLKKVFDPNAIGMRPSGTTSSVA